MDAPVIVANLPAASEALLKSAKNSPNSAIKNKRHNHSVISCSSQVNNNYSSLDMESLDDMLIKVVIFFLFYLVYIYV